MQRLLLFCALIGVSCAKFPPTFRKCKRNQPDLKKCLLAAAQDGLQQLERPLPNLREPNLNPFFIPEMFIGEGKGTVAVEQKFKNCNLYGIPNFKFQEFDLDFDKKTLNIMGIFPEFKLQCQYELDGKVLLLPIQGSGPSTIIFKNLNITVHMLYEEVKKNDKTFAKFTSNEIDTEQESITYNFENLFNGDKRLGDNVNQVLNENWSEVYEDVKSGYLKVFAEIIRNVFNAFFSKVSLEEALD